MEERKGVRLGFSTALLPDFTILILSTILIFYFSFGVDGNQINSAKNQRTLGLCPFYHLGTFYRRKQSDKPFHSHADWGSYTFFNV